MASLFGRFPYYCTRRWHRCRHSGASLSRGAARQLYREREPIDMANANWIKKKTNWSVYRKSLLYCIRLKGEL